MSQEQSKPNDAAGPESKHTPIPGTLRELRAKIASGEVLIPDTEITPSGVIVLSYPTSPPANRDAAINWDAAT